MTMFKKKPKFDFNNLYAEDVNESLLDDLDKSLIDIGNMARKCLGNEDFVTYREQFEVAYSKILDAMIAYTNNFFNKDDNSADVYAMSMVRYITKIQLLKVLLGQIERDSKKGMTKEGNKDG